MNPKLRLNRQDAKDAKRFNKLVATRFAPFRYSTPTFQAVVLLGD
jgi:hypothetical protein